MATITLKNIPTNIYNRLKMLAKLNHRTLKGEILYNLESVMGTSKDNSEGLRLKIKKLRESVNGEISPEEIEKAINEGRP